jgi:hypothetical protein
MKLSITPLILCSAVLAANQCSVLSAERQTAAASAPMTRSETVLVTITASVQAINPDAREVTLKGPLGNSVTFTVDQRVKRLKDVKVGDLVQADYYISVAAELRKPTPEEEKEPLVVLGAGGKAPPGTSPAAGGLRRFKVVTTIEGLDRSTETVTVKGPLGNYLTVRVADPAILTQLRIGENIVVTYTEALAISLDKVERKSPK